MILFITLYMHDSYLASQKTNITENGSDIAQTNVSFAEMTNDTMRPIVNVDNACVTMLIGNPIACTESQIMTKLIFQIQIVKTESKLEKCVPFANYLHRQTV